MLHRAAAYCTAAERCIQDVEKKLSAAGLPSDVAERIIARLVQEKFIDESRYSRGFVSDKLRFNKWGRIKIAYELRRKHLPENVCSEALSAIDEEEYHALLLSLLKEKKKTIRGKGNRDVFGKLLRFGVGRGFETSEVAACLRTLGANETDDEESMD